jgi:hypothetical protein
MINEIDYEAIAWAYQKLINFGIDSSTFENALMMDRIKDILEQENV